MRKIYYLLIGILFSLSQLKVSAQTVMTNATTLNQCGGTFADPGGNGNSGNNLNVTETICSGVAGQCVTIQFTSFSLDNGFDFLYIYNGTTATAPNLVGTYTGSSIPAQVTSTTGCLTLKYTSDGIVQSAGWVANLICTPCGSPPPPPPGPTVASDCSQAVQICTNASFQIDPNGYGAVNEIPAAGGTSNPLYGGFAEPTNPLGTTNQGCLRSGETNSTWMIITCQTAGVLQF